MQRQQLTKICPDLLYNGSCNIGNCPKRHDAKLCEICHVICCPDSTFDAHLQSVPHQAKAAILDSKALKCALCSIVVTGRAPWDQHVAGAAHRKMAQAKGTSPRVDPVDPSVPAGHKRCPLCRRNIVSTAWSQHLQGQDHRKHEMVAGYRALYEQAQLDKNSVSVTHPHGVNFGVIDMSRSEEGITLNLTLTTTNPTARIDVVSAIAYTTSTKSANVFSVTLPSRANERVVAHAHPVTCSVQARHDVLGTYDGYVEITFEDAVKRRFAIIRQVKATIGSVQDYQLLKPQVPYKGKARVPWPKVRAFVPGRRPPALDAVPWVKKLPQAEIQAFLLSILTAQPENEATAKLRTSHVPPTLNGYNHGEFFKLLLWIEEFKADRDLRAYDMADVQFRKEGYHYIMAVPGLAEKRPSVVVGDRIEAQVANSSSGRCFEGFVHVVRLEDVCLRFGPSFKPTNGQRFNVRFKLNRIPLRRQHEALAAKGPALRVVLFPELSDASSHEAVRSEPPPRLYDNRLKNNTEQLRAVTSIMRLKPGSAPFIVFGPPGTGKTSTIVEAILQVLARDATARVLACAPSNSAADEILERLSTNLSNDSMFRFNAVSRDRITIPEGLFRYCHTNPQGVFSVPSQDCLKQYKVTVSTCVSAAFAYGIGLRPGYFTHIFIDEAAQATEAEVMAAVKRMTTSSTTIVLSGDPKQLGPIIRSEIARNLGFSKSYMERLMERPVYNVNAVRQKMIIKLLKNYRSHKAILDFPNEQFYDSDLQPCAAPSVVNTYIGSHVLASSKFPVVFHAITSNDDQEASSPSYFNIGQATLVKSYVTRLLGQGTRADDIGIITPYNAQAKKIRKLLTGVADTTTVGTVEAFQGKERRVIIVSTVRSTRELLTYDIKHALGFIANPRRFNVAVTRAQALLIVIGDPSVLSLDPLWRAFMNYVYQNSGWKGDTPSWDTNVPVDNSGDYVQEVLQASVEDLDEFARRMEQLVLEGVDGADAEDTPWREVE
ncbi:hypothetical protein CERSUDRAFT_158351 [Gelatoporia subvermispora B]|uniref:RNA helicase n=1 Tax=Ceriporiopsis subvermispora (strain B) TaxID=914234 RepID=M2QRB4_CERS8|nr:hypothetical protein CERSUDRAFT_158351 [Gelatoporia subvermispora B]